MIQIKGRKMRKDTKPEDAVHVRIGKTLTKILPVKARIKRQLLIQQLGEDMIDEVSETVKYEALSKAFFKVRTDKEGQIFNVFLDLIIDWNNFLLAYKKGCDSLYYATKKELFGEEMKKPLDWLKRPKLDLSKKYKYIEKSFSYPDFVLDEIITYADLTRKKGFEEEILDRNRLKQQKKQ